MVNEPGTSWHPINHSCRSSSTSPAMRYASSSRPMWFYTTPVVGHKRMTFGWSYRPPDMTTPTHVVPLPETLTPGAFALTATLMPATGPSLLGSASWVVPDASLRTFVEDRSLTAGQVLTLTVNNEGGVDTTAGYQEITTLDHLYATG